MRYFAKLCVAAVLGLPLAAPAFGQTTGFDGGWSVEVVTREGACDRAYRYSVVIENGAVRYGGPEQFDVRGQVRPNGSVAANISRGQDRANITGRLSGKSGTGTWSSSGGRVCSGQWNAEKRS